MAKVSEPLASIAFLKRHLRKSTQSRSHPLTLHGQFLDSRLLRQGKLYRRSRELFLEQGGILEPALLSSPRALGSDSLLDNKIEYTPHDAELTWILTAPALSDREEAFVRLRGLSTSVYHEQNHRILWARVLPPPPLKGPELTLYLNFAEALVVMLDAALADSLPLPEARAGYVSGVLYGRNTTVKRDAETRRRYRNYLHALAYGTYLTLGRYDRDAVPGIIQGLYGEPGSRAGKKPTFSERALLRAEDIDPRFVDITNPSWQSRHARKAARKLSRRGAEPLLLPIDPEDNRVVYLITERVLDLYGI